MVVVDQPLKTTGAANAEPGQGVIAPRRGPPRILKRVEDFEARLNQWLRIYIDKEGKFTPETEAFPPTTCGFARFLGFGDKSLLYDYLEHDNGAFAPLVKKGLALVEEWHEYGLSKGQCGGHIFGLKNMGWKDTQHQNIGDGNGNPLRVIFNVPRPDENSDR